MLVHKLPCGRDLLLDEEDAHLLCYSWYSAKNWNVTYAQRWNGKGTTLFHVDALGKRDGFVLDHIDGNGLNNCRSNLRLVTAAQNSWNRRTRKDSASGIKGVYLERDGYWRGQVMCHGVKYRKCFKTADDAAQWVRDKREELHGEFARHG